MIAPVYPRPRMQPPSRSSLMRLHTRTLTTYHDAVRAVGTDAESYRLRHHRQACDRFWRDFETYVQLAEARGAERTFKRHLEGTDA